jgi:threonine dehydrogenase-like Zn-dependent dehydrogenase
MATLVATDIGTLRWEEAELPVIETGTDALVQPVAVTLCDLDRPVLSGRFPLPMPIPFGHEFVGEARAIGAAVTSVAVGDLVVVPFQISCGACGHCLAGLTANCESVPRRSQYGFGAAGGPWGCGFSDLVRVPFADHMLLRVPEGVDASTVAAAGDNLGDGYRCVAPHLARRPEADVLVLGGIGSVALYAVMFATALGARRVDYVDGARRVDSVDGARRRLDVAAGYGARAMDAIDPTERYDIVIDGTSFDPDGLATACRAIRPDGTIVGATMYVNDPVLPYLDLYMKGAHFHTGRVHARAEAEPVLAMIAAGAVDPRLVTDGEILPWADAEHLMDTGTKPVFVR